VKLSPHFDLEEFTRSARAKREGIDNTPPPFIVDNLRALCVKVLEPLREAVGAPIVVTSGYRCPILNARTPGASSTSDHTKGRAADIHVPGVALADLIEIARTSVWEWKQLIHERIPARGEGVREWLHISYDASDPPRSNPKQVLRIFK
jgi:zinc D-Ala-D-Ala carboxypeptidase